jgi:hypothetical protein
MAVNNHLLTERVRKAADYFDKLRNSVEVLTEAEKMDASKYYRWLNKDKRVVADEGEMMEAAAWAALIFNDSSKREEIREKLGYTKYASGTAVFDGTASKEVTDMCAKYASGERKFDQYEIENAHRLCLFLVDYIERLEKEKPIISV